MKFTVDSNLAAISLKDYLRQHIGISMTEWRKIKHCPVFVNGAAVNPAVTRLKPLDTVSYKLLSVSAVIPQKLPLAIVFEDDYLLVVNKPAGQLVHPTVKESLNTLANAVIYYLSKSDTSSAFHPVHRLDRNTSGLVLIAKMPHIQHLLSQANHHLLQRSYLALVSGCPASAAGDITLPIKRSPDSIITRITAPDGVPAHTKYKVLKSNKFLSLLELKLYTGRTHQLRVHLSACGHPIIGDDLYGGDTSLLSRQALHAARLKFIHPATGQPIFLTAPLPEDMQTIISDQL